MSRPELVRRAEEYASRQGLTIKERLGAGVHGIVFSAQGKPGSGESAIKSFERRIEYRRERDVYFRLRENEITSIRGCNVPELLGFDDDLLVIEISMVIRPFVLDFAGAYLDFPPEFSEEVMADWRADKIEQFEQRWPEVQAILGALEEYGIYMLDVNPGNISFGDNT